MSHDANIVRSLARLEAKIDRIEAKLDGLLMELAAEEEEERPAMRTLDGGFAGAPREDLTPL